MARRDPARRAPNNSDRHSISAGRRPLPAVIGAALWIAISYATGGPTPFSLGGGILIGVIAFIVGYGFRRLILDRRTP
jgi:hypothetical protein